MSVCVCVGIMDDNVEEEDDDDDEEEEEVEDVDAC